MKILVIEDELDLLHAICKGLRRNGYCIDTASDGAEGLALCSINEYDLLILDLNLPSMDGIEVLTALRKENKELRILILSARGALQDRIKGLDLGANDYLVKPFHFEELDARVRSLLRRSFIQNDTILECGKIRLNTVRHMVLVEETVVDLTPREYSILEYLMLHKNVVVSAERLIEHTGEHDGALFSNALKVHISAIRKKLSAHVTDDPIKNVRGLGYLMEEEE